MIQAARLCFEEERYDQGDELLQMAIEQSPEAEALRLAQLEFTFLRRDARRFVCLASDLRQALPDSGSWHEIARLGRALAPTESLFVTAARKPTNDHYGPWPEMPNWIRASWDLTAEVLAADFHRAMVRRETERSHVQLAKEA